VESDDAEDGPELQSTVFNGQDVPPMIMLSGTEFTEQIGKGYWYGPLCSFNANQYTNSICRLVEFFSPYCHHCIRMAPTWQTLYEFYYTSNPMSSSFSSSSSSSSSSSADSEGLNSFTRYYDFKFAKLDCVAFGTACSSNKINAFPTIVLFKDGQKVKESVGEKSMQALSQFVEETLESIRPGSRPKEGPKLPDAGAKEVDSAAKPENPQRKDKNPAAGAAAASKHNALASKVATATAIVTATAIKKTSPHRATGTANPSGKSTDLTAETFQKLVTTTRDPWFVKFYAPWCHHCQAMAPNWLEMAREMKGILNVGEVNCDKEKRLCKDARVKGYPTIVFFRGGERVEYNGLRGVGDLITFGKKALDVGLGVEEVDAESFKKLEETEEVIFLYFYDHATVSEDFKALERLTLSLIGHGKLVKTQDPKLCEHFKISTWPRLMVSRDGKPSYYPWIAPKDMRDFRKILNWMKTVWQPLVPELTAANAREITADSVVVLGILSRERSDEFIIAKREIKNAAIEWIDRETQQKRLERQELRDAKQLRMEEAEDRDDERALRAARNTRIVLEDRPEVKFAWVDGEFWERWIKTTFGISADDGERVVILDEDVSQGPPVQHIFWPSLLGLITHVTTRTIATGIAQ
jgi:protein disulfide-isomerase